MKKKGTAQIMFHLCRYWQSELCSTHRLRSRAHILSLLRFTGIMVSRAQLFSKVNKSIHHPYCQAKACSHANVLLHFKVKIRTCQQQHPQVPGESCHRLLRSDQPAAFIRRHVLNSSGMHLLRSALTWITDSSVYNRLPESIPTCPLLPSTRW